MVSKPISEESDKVAGQKRFKHSVAHWTLAATEWNWNIDQICDAANQLGIESVELTPPGFFPKLKEHGLTCALAFNGMPDPPFVRGLNNPAHHEEIISRTRNTIDQCADYGFANVIAFVGYKWKNAEDPKSGEIARELAIENTVKGLKALAPYAEKRNVSICLEHLNSRDGSHPMKGHPGYQGDDLDLCAEILEKVGNSRVRLLFDIYHVQVMHGDVIRRLRQCAHLIGHIHTAGNPGRGELDDNQEIHYPGVVKALSEIGYNGYVGHEFIPTADPARGLAEAVRICESQSLTIRSSSSR
jgi:hydroxypyruvate isomerase